MSDAGMCMASKFAFFLSKVAVAEEIISSPATLPKQLGIVEFSGDFDQDGIPDKVVLKPADYNMSTSAGGMAASKYTLSFFRGVKTASGFDYERKYDMCLPLLGLVENCEIGNFPRPRGSGGGASTAWLSIDTNDIKCQVVDYRRSDVSGHMIRSARLFFLYNSYENLPCPAGKVASYRDDSACK